MTTQQDALQDLVRISEELGLYDGEFNDEGAGMKELTDEQIDDLGFTARIHLAAPGTGKQAEAARKLARAAIAADRALNSAALTPRIYEKEHAIKEGHRNKAEDDYFNARPQVDFNANRVYFKDGFDRGWDAAKNDAPADRDVMRQVPEGWKLVPIEPTLDQYNSACRAYSDWQVQCQEEAREHEDERNPSWGYSQPHFTHSDVYRAMLAAAPTPPAEQYNERLFTVVASAYQILGALDAPAHILDVLSDPLGASDERVEAMLPYVPAEQQPVAHFAVHTCPGGEFEYVQVESEGRGTIPLYTRPAPSLATLRAEVEGLRNVFSPPDYFPNKAVWLKEVLSLIDKLGDGV